MYNLGDIDQLMKLLILGNRHQPGYSNSKGHHANPLSVVSVTFLVAVNQTETKCLMTSKTPPLKPGILHNQTDYISVGKCDYGALDFNITTLSKSVSNTVDI